MAKPYFRALRNKSTTLSISRARVGDREDQEIVVCNAVLSVPPRGILLDRLGIWDMLRQRKGAHFFIRATKEQMDEVGVPPEARKGDGFINPAHLLEDITAEYEEVQRETLDEVAAFEHRKTQREKAEQADKLIKENAILLEDKARWAKEKEAYQAEIADLKARMATENIKRAGK